MVVKNIRKFILITKLGLFDGTIVPFGMKNVASTFSNTITEVIGIFLEKFLKVFVDDFNVHNITWEKHLEHLCYVLLRLKEVNLKLNPSKCEFVNSNLTF